ncbi:MAG: YbaK/EbsC family protein [Deltaproteobacteria bacterium]|nr:YbaK/EbsC family protein [Deltaproteobacteria bacterium]
MSIDNAREHLKFWNRDNDIIEFEKSSATVELAAKALNTEESRIAKTLSFKIENKAILIITAGNMKIDNRKYKDEYGCKAVMLSPEEVKELIGHEIGGVCPFGIKNDVNVYLDISLKKYDFVYPACGSPNSAIKMTYDELGTISRAKKWVDVCKEKNSEQKTTSSC